jgi:aerobic carbon-monoxide dehydrogenase large subunit
MKITRADHLQPVARSEARMLTGDGLYVDDIALGDQAYGYMVRSSHPHARILDIDVSKAEKSGGVLAVLTGKAIDGVAKALPCVMPLVSYDGKPRAEADRSILATDRVRHIGDGVAFIVAGTIEQAVDAAALIEIDYELLPEYAGPVESNVDVPIWPDAPDNVCFTWRFGDRDATRRLFESAAHVIELELRMPRIVVNAIEPRSAIGIYDPNADQFTLVANTQGVHFVRHVLARSLGIIEQKLRVLTPNVGGGFGSKIYAYPEHALVLLAARAVGRPVRWTATRHEAFLSDTQGRGHTTKAAIALDRDGCFLALSVHPTVDLGAYLSQYAPLTATGVGAPVQGGGYRFKAIEIEVRGIFTNMPPVDAFRGAGRPEATYVLERLIDRAAEVLGIDAAELRARNLVDTPCQPFAAVTGLIIEGGRFLNNQRRCLDIADRAGFAARRTESAKRGRIRGFGFANYLEDNGGTAVAKKISPGGFPLESAGLKFGVDGSLDIVIGTQSTGQDHASPMVLYAAKHLGLEIEKITVREGDSDALAVGGGTGGSKSLLTSSVAIEAALRDVVAKGRALLAREWAVDAADIAFHQGVFSLARSNRTMSIPDIAAQFSGALDGQSLGKLHHGSNANGCHACEIEIDPETGDTQVVRYTAVDDFGAVVNEGAVLGQVHGGVANGIGQALFESTPSWEELEHPTATSSFHYPIPSATNVPGIAWTDNGLQSATNAFGAKACGESGASAAPPTVMNAIVDALKDYPEAWKIQMPARPVDIWNIIHH